MAMARRYTTLRKKLRELEAKVVELLTLPPETPHHELLSDGVEQQLDSLKALVSVEMASHPSSSKPSHLLHITEKLSELEVAFREWDYCRSAAVSGVDDECSCGGESGMNEDEDDDRDINMEELGFKVYDVPKELREDDDGDDDEEKWRPDEKTHHVRRPSYNGGGVEAAIVWDAGKYYRVWATRTKQMVSRYCFVSETKQIVSGDCFVSGRRSVSSLRLGDEAYASFRFASSRRRSSMFF